MCVLHTLYNVGESVTPKKMWQTWDYLSFVSGIVPLSYKLVCTPHQVYLQVISIVRHSWSYNQLGYLGGPTLYLHYWVLKLQILIFMLKIKGCHSQMICTRGKSCQWSLSTEVTISFWTGKLHGFVLGISYQNFDHSSMNVPATSIPSAIARNYSRKVPKMD